MEVSVDGKQFRLTEKEVAVKHYEKTVHVEEIIPSVIEPSFGIGRIMYACFEQNFRSREGDEQRSVRICERIGSDRTRPGKVALRFRTRPFLVPRSTAFGRSRQMFRPSIEQSPGLRAVR